MKQHTAEFKQELIKMGKQIDSVITYTLNGETITLHDELYAVTPLFEANLLKSVMKQLEVESSIAIPYGTVINYQLGIKVGNSFEYLDYGNYVVFSNDKQEDTNTYKITCYDKMIYSMKPYDKITGNYPMTIKSYLGLLANKIGLTLKDTNFYNYSLEIQTDLYEDLEYTYRDVLDEIAQATGSIIIINADDQIEVIYSSDSNDTIDENYFKDVNVNFSQKYGPINSIVLSRAGESDNVYIQDEDSIRANGLCEVKIVDNQIMNFNDRSDYLQGLLDALDGVEYYINDFESIGVLYYDVGDYYNVQIGENTYKCLMLNSEINVTSGLKEIIHTDMPEQGETDYTKADKTDRKINRTNLIVDKQNQVIDGIVTEVDEQNDKIAEIKATTDDIEMQVANMYNATKTVTAIKTVVMEKCIKGYLLKLRIKGNNSVFDRLYPADDLYPSDTLYPRGDSRIIVTDENGNSMMYELRVNEVLRANEEVYDEYILEDNFAKVIRRVNPDGTTKINEEVENIGTYTIYVSQGTNTLTIKNYSASIEAVYVEQNAYTDQFATKIEMNSAIDVSQDSVITTVNKKLINEYSTSEEVSAEIEGEVSNAVTEMTSTITQTAESINSEVRKKVGKNEVISSINQSAEAVQINANKISLNGKTINLNSENVAIQSNNFNVDTNGNMTCNNAKIIGGNISISSDNGQSGGATNFTISKSGRYVTLKEYYNRLLLKNSDAGISASVMVGDASSGVAGSISLNNDLSGTEFIGMSIDDLSGSATFTASGGGTSSTVTPSFVRTPQVIQTSKAEEKKNFEKYSNALKTLKNIDIYKYNLKFEKDTDKKHIGFVIGENYKYLEELTNNDNSGVDIYSLASYCLQVCKEQQEIIDELQKEIKELKGGN